MVSIQISKIILDGWNFYPLYSFGSVHVLGLNDEFLTQCKIGYGQKRAREQCGDETDSTNSSAHMSARRNAERWIIAKTFNNLYSYPPKMRPRVLLLCEKHTQKNTQRSTTKNNGHTTASGPLNQQHPIASQLTE